MDTSFWTTVSASIGAVAFFGGITAWVWIDSRNKRHERELKHAERLKALELGHSLPDAEIAKAGAELGHAWALGLTCTFVPLGLVGIALGATALVFAQEMDWPRFPLLCVIWGVVGVISIVTVSCCMGAMSRKPGYSTGGSQRGGKSMSEESGHIREMHTMA